MPSPRHAGLAAALTVVLVCAGATSALASPRVSATLSNASVTAGQSVTLSGRAKPAGAHPVRVQMREAGRWVTRASTSTAARSGAFTVTLSTAAAGRFVFRATLPASDHRAAVVSRRVRLAVHAAGAGSPCCTASVPIIAPPPGTNAFRAIYAVAADQSGDPDKAAAIGAAIAAAGGWFSTQTTGSVQPRWVRDINGAVAVQIVTLPQPAAEFATTPFDTVAAELEAASPNQPGQKSVVWLDASAPSGCGQTNPSRGISILFEAKCDIHPAQGARWPGGGSYLVAHEVAHSLGAVPDCAPHAGSGGHVVDDPRDLLYAGSSPRDWANLILDPGHDDYYATGSSACPGIESSGFWTSTSAPLS